MVAYIDKRLEKIFDWNRYPKGEIGIEVEVEGGPWPERAITNWISHPDNSLRNNGIEYIIRQPVLRDRVRPALDTLEESLRASNKVFSYRTSIHVHVNVQDLTVRQWVNFIALFAIFEESLVNVVGPERAGNKFCLRLKDADEPLLRVRDGIREQQLRNSIAGDLKYASMNVKATVSHGTLEFRAMRGNLDPAFITAWTDVLTTLKDHAKAALNPRHFVEQMSGIGPHEFARRYLPAGNTITRDVLMQENLGDSMYEGARLAQDVAYCVDWGDPPAVADSPRKKNLEPDFEDVQVQQGIQMANFVIGDILAAPARPRRVRVAAQAPIDDMRFFHNPVMPDWNED